ncbi:MAG: ammonia-forming cytochrome c nitrite reductase subunit c552 [Ignavibacteria bacterium GWF2_33_9]|nr:MAG: ammonia-forming cytochrome c nitrite reductase subunit c552 [Ignavibacteria bacterium GWF2_33_9]
MKKNLLYVIIAIAMAAVIFGLGILASSITERKAEKEFTYKPVVKIGENEPRNDVWGENFRREYETYLLTEDTTFRTKFNGNAMRDALEEDPRMVVLWAGYAFSKDYNQPRGHRHAVTDIRNTLRTGGPLTPDEGPMPATCWTCKSPDVPRMMEEKGITEFYIGKWAGKGQEIVNPIGCLDCHDPSTMNLRISRPALIEAFERQGKDITKSTLQDMRSLVCAQCHVEYYFDKTKVENAQYLTFPWDKGSTVEDMEKYYDEIEFSDWTHSLSRTPMLKAQHPDYEVHKLGIHGQRNVACADCHMPYISEGGQKYSSHHLVSPLKYIDKTCMVCHRESEETLRNNVYEHQEKILENKILLEDVLVRLHLEAKKAWDLGATETEMKDILSGIRRTQWRWDFSVASHGAAFHAPIEILRIMGNAINIGSETRVKLARILAKYGFNQELSYPDISTKAKAQKLIGLDMEKLNAEKQEFLKTIVPKWLVEAKERESKWKIIRY